jgi:hypothetical protein
MADVLYNGVQAQKSMIGANHRAMFLWNNNNYHLLNPMNQHRVDEVHGGGSDVISHFMGFTTAGFGGPTPDAESKVSRVIFQIPYQKVTKAASPNVSVGGGQFKVRLPDDTMVNLSSPTVLTRTSSHAIIYWTLASAVPSHTPCILVYGNSTATITINDTYYTT